MKNGRAPSADPEWLTTRELCDWLRIKPKDLYWLNYKGEGPRYHKIGREHRYRRSDVELWLEQRAVEGRAG